eukprot:g32699.t1
MSHVFQDGSLAGRSIHEVKDLSVSEQLYLYERTRRFKESCFWIPSGAENLAQISDLFQKAKEEKKLTLLMHGQDGKGQDYAGLTYCTEFNEASEDRSQMPNYRCLVHDSHCEGVSEGKCAPGYTTNGCECARSWVLEGHDECHDSCCTPTGESSWCMVTDPTCQGLAWGPCSAESKNPHPHVRKTAKGCKCSNGWSVKVGEDTHSCHTFCCQPEGLGLEGEERKREDFQDAPPLCEVVDADVEERVDNPDSTVYLIFMEGSTRTRESLRNAAVYHGVKVNEFQAESSSFKKNETITDTIKMLSVYSTQRSIFRQQRRMGVPTPSFVNAGDGLFTHPIGEFVDIFSLLEHNKWDRSAVHLALVGDLAHGRTAHSKVQGLKIFKKVRVDLVAPEIFGYPVEYTDRMREAGFEVRCFGSVEDGSADRASWERCAVLEVEAFPAKGFVNKGFVGPGGISEFTGMSWRAEDGGIPEGDELVE